MSNADYSSINFSIIGNSSQYVKLSDTELYVRINIEKEDGTPFTTTNDNGDTLPAGARETGAPIDFILHSMWSSVDIKLNNNLISESGTNYMYKALLEALANEGFSRDSGDFSQTNPEAPPYNHGLKTRFKWFKEHGVVEFVGPLMSDIL